MAREFGPEIAAPVKEAVTRTDGLVLVKSLPIDPAIRTLNIGISGDKGIAYAPGAVLFVALENPTYDLAEITRKRGELVGNITDGRVASNERAVATRSEGKDWINLGYIRFEEEADPVRVQTKTTKVYSADNPFVQSLLRNAEIAVGQTQTYERERTYHVTRDSYVVVYPSVLFANVAAEFKRYHEMIRGSSRPRLSIWYQGFGGAMTSMSGEDFRRLAATDTEQLSLEQVVSRYIPDKGLLSA